jgi:hypothetical protein
MPENAGIFTCTRQHAHVSFITHEPNLFGLDKIKTYLSQDPHNRAYQYPHLTGVNDTP